MDSSNLNSEQKKAFEMMVKWLEKTGDNRFVMSGYAGCGKSFTLSVLREHLIEKNKNFAFMAYTGKAVDVLRRKGIQECATIHSTIYKPIYVNGVLDGWRKAVASELPDILIVDEYSMLSKDIIEDIESFEKKVIYSGDFFQLPPIGEDDSSLRRYTNISLETIVRQAEGNPVIRYATKLRNFEPIDYIIEENENGELFALINGSNNHIDRLLQSYDQVLCGTNKTRNSLNSRIRNMRNFHGDIPNPGEKVICLKNNKNSLVFNGQIKYLKNIIEHNNIGDHRYFSSEMVDYDGISELFISSELFYDNTFKINEKIFARSSDEKYIKAHMNYFDYAYAITVHKSQGDQFENVLIYGGDGTWMRENYNRWLYTAVTRAEKKCVMII